MGRDDEPGHDPASEQGADPGGGEGPPPSGLPAEEDQHEDAPLGVPEADPEGEGDTPRGEDAMPGLPSQGEPPTAG